MSPDPQLFKPTMGNICVLDPNQLLLITTVIFNNSGHIVHIVVHFYQHKLMIGYRFCRSVNKTYKKHCLQGKYGLKIVQF